MPTGFDHIIAMVHDIDAAVADFTAAGFEIVQRPDAALTETDNRFISFPDGSYFQICSFFDPAKSASHKWAHLFAEGEGWVDYAMRTDDAAAVHARLTAAGLEATEPRVSTKPLTDGRSWVASILHAGRGAGASPLRPYFVEDRADRAIRVPPPTRPQAGNAQAIAGLTLLTGNLSAALPALDAIYGGGTAIEPRLEGGERAWLYELASGWVEIVEISDMSSEAGHHLSARGEGIYEVLIGSREARPGDGALLSPGSTHGARIRAA